MIACVIALAIALAMALVVVVVLALAIVFAIAFAIGLASKLVLAPLVVFAELCLVSLVVAGVAVIVTVTPTMNRCHRATWMLLLVGDSVLLVSVPLASLMSG